MYIMLNLVQAAPDTKIIVGAALDSLNLIAVKCTASNIIKVMQNPTTFRLA